MFLSKGRKNCFFAFLLMAIAVGVLGCSTQPTAPAATKKVTDMAGRQTSFNGVVSKVVTLGSVPVINGFVFALGEGDKISSGLPAEFTRSDRWKYQEIFAPSILNKPIVQGANREPVMEELLKIKPDVIFTMDKSTINIMEKNNLPVVFLSWTEPEDVKKTIAVVAEVFNKQAKAKEYISYFDDTLNKVKLTVSAIPQAQRVKVLYCNVRSLSQPHLIAEWWIPEAGGISVTNNGRKTESVSFSIEQLLAWNPDVLIVSNPKEVNEVYKDPRFSQIRAVVNKRVVPTPVGAHVWANRTIEQPLTVLWAAKTFYPEQFKDLDLELEIGKFYEKFFNSKLSREQVKDILRGR